MRQAGWCTAACSCPSAAGQVLHVAAQPLCTAVGVGAVGLSKAMARAAPQKPLSGARLLNWP